MNLLTAAGALLAALLLLLVAVTRVGVWIIERDHPPVGAFAEANGARLHYVHLAGGADADLPPILFLHGASGTLNDPLIPIRPHLEGRAELLFVDRPGHGWSERGIGNETPFGQASTIAALMDGIGIESAIVVGHSFGGAVAAALALEHPERVAGLVFLSPASHPWPGGDTSWHYGLAATPIIGRLFSETLALPGGLAMMRQVSACVFSPNRLPETFLKEAGIALLMRPGSFRANAVDVAGLYDHVRAASPRYGDIAVPSVVVSGDRDTVVYAHIHAGGLIRDIPGARGVFLRNMGHKPDWVAPEMTVAAIESAAGGDVDVDAVARGIEARMADDAFETERCAPAPADLIAPEG